MTRVLPLPRPSRFLLLAATLVALAVLVVGDGAPPAQASSHVLVSNLGQTTASVNFHRSTASSAWAQGFTTGSESAGYTLGSIEAKIGNAPTSAQRDTIGAELWSSSGGVPNAKLADLTVPDHPISAGTVKFTDPANTTLTASTLYFFIIYTTGNFNLSVSTTAATAQDSSSATGWTINDRYHFPSSGSDFNVPSGASGWGTSGGTAYSIQLGVNAPEAVPVALTALTLESSADGSTFTAVTGASTLAPAFDAATTGYRATVGNDVTHVRLTATEAGGGRVFIGTNFFALQSYDSGTPSVPIPLQVGDNFIGVAAIGAPDYTVMVRRVPAGSEWWATFTPGTGTNNVGCETKSECDSALTANGFTLGGRDFYFSYVLDNDSNALAAANALEIGFSDSTGGSTREPNAALKALNFCVGPGEYPLTTPAGLNSYRWANANLPWVAGAPVSLSIGTSCGTDGAAGPGPGDLDPAFSADSILTTAIGSDGDRGFAVARQDDGKIVVAGYSYNGSDQDFAVVRYTAGGVLDPTFGNGGMVVTDFGASRNEEAYAVAIQSDGKIVVAGQAGNGSNWDFAVVRYTADGELDTTFSTDGKAAVHFDNNEYARAVAIQSDGKIVVAGWAEITGQNNNFALARFNADGTPDTSFSTDGKLHTRFGSSNTAIQEATALAIQSDGKIVVAGNGGNGTNRDFLVARYTTAGVLDTTFGADNDSSGAPDGWRLTPVGSDNDKAYGVAVDGSGNIILAGETDASGGPDVAVVRYTSTGALDTSFSSDGKVTTGIGSAGDRGRAVRIDANGKIVVGGYSYNGSDQDFAVVRYDTDGSLDTDFHSDGKATAAVGSGNDEAHAMVLDADGNILLAGHSVVGSHPDIALAAFTAGGEPAAILDRGITTTAVGSGDDTANAVAVQPDGKIVAAGYSSNGTDNDFAVVRYNADGTLDTGFSSDGKVTTAVGSGEDEAGAVALQADGKIVAAGSSNNGSDQDFALVRYNADGSLHTGFGTGGKVTTAIGSGNDGASAVALQSDGKIVAAGYSHNGTDNDFAVVRYNADGTLDTGFGTGGKVTTAVGSSSIDLVHSVAVQSDGKIVAAGYSGNDFAVVRYNADGTLDTGFGTGGKVTTAVGSNDDEARSVAVQSDGKIVLAGYSNNGSDWDFAVVRYNADGSLDTGFGAGGVVTTAVGSGDAVGDADDSAYSVAVQADGKIVASGNGGNYFAVVRYNADGSLDTGFGANGAATTVIGSGGAAYAAAIQPDDNKIVLAGYSNNATDRDFAVARYLPGEVVPLETPPAFLVSNAGQTKHTVAYSHGAQGFTTGSESGGYALGSIDVVIGSAPTSAQRDTIRAELWSATTGGAPDEKLADLTVPAHPIGAGTVSFPAPANTTLSASTKYFVHLHSTTSHQLELATTLSDDEDSGGAVGWSIENTTYYLSSGSFFRNTVTPDIAIQITVKEAEAQQTLSPTDLSALAAESSTDGSNFTAMTGAETPAPAFDAATTGYRATVGNGVTHVRLTPTLADTASSLQVGKAGSLATVVSGNASAAIALDVGDNAITVRVADTNGNTRDYTVTVRRVTAGSEWWATLTPVTQTDHAGVEQIGCSDSSTCDTALSDNTVTVGTHSNSFARITDGANDFFHVLFTAATTAELTALNFCVGDSAYSIDSSSHSVSVSADVGWTAGAPVSLSLGASCALATQLPGAVTNLVVDPGVSVDKELPLSWTAPSGVVTGYDVQYKRDIAPDQPATQSNLLTGWVDAYHSGIATKFTITSLTNHLTFDVRVRAVNSLGSGPWSQTQGRTSRDEPAPVTGLTVAAGNQELRLSWTAPVQNVTGYQVEYKESTASAWTAADHTGIATKATIDELTNGTTYDVRVRAVNRVDNLDHLGESWVQAQGRPTDTVVKTLADGGPGKGHIGRVDEHDAALTVAWGKPATGLTAGEGSAVTGYDLEYKESTAGSWTGTLHTGLARFRTITGLTNGTTYDLRVRARTEGSVAGEWSDTAQGTPRAANLPPQPRAASATGSGALDTTFDTDGKATADFASFGDQANAVAVQDDGKIVVAGYSYQASSDSDFALVRYNADGSLDAGFGTGGRVTTGFGNPQDSARAVAVQRDGRIVVAGRSDNDIALARYTRSGALDASFGSGGKVTTSFFSGSTHWAYAVTLQPDGKIVVAGAVGSDGLVVRYTRSGTLDASFGDGGRVVTDLGSSFDTFSSIAVRHDGRIVAAGERRHSGRNEFVLARYTADGALDDSFGNGGMVTTASSEGIVARAVLLLPGGEVVAAGYDRGANERFVLARYTHYGALDRGFGNGGRVFTHVRSGDDRAYAMALQPDGKILLAGYSHGGGNNDFAVARYDEYGRLDPAFGSGGVLTVAVGSGDDRAHAMALQPDGKIVLAGYSHNGSNDDFALVRFVVEPRKAWIDGIEAGNASLTVTWGLPLGDPTGYDVEYKASTAAAWTDAGHADATRTVTIGSLTNGATYDVRVRATNGIGAGLWSNVRQGTPTGSGAQGAEGGTAQPTAVTLSLDAATVSESAGEVTVTATLDAPAPEGGIGGFLFAGEDGTATEDVDFTMPLSIFIPGGQRSATAAISITDDAVDEADETVVVSALFDMGTALLEDKITLTITDDDPPEQQGQDPVNSAPTVASAIDDATIVNESGTQQVSLSGVFSDADSDALTVTAASSDEAVATVSVASDYSTLTVTAKSRGTAAITVTADDGNGGTVSDAFTVNVKAAPVVASALADLSMEEEENRDISLSGVFSDADGDSLTITVASSDAAVDALEFQGTLTLVAVSAGTSTITVTATDSDGNAVSDAFDVTVTAPQKQDEESTGGPPTLAAPLPDVSLEGPEWRQISLDGVFSGNGLTFTTASSNYGVASVWVSGSTLMVVGTGTGTATITVTAQDADGNTVSDEFEVTVSPAS